MHFTKQFRTNNGQLMELHFKYEYDGTVTIRIVRQNRIILEAACWEQTPDAPVDERQNKPPKQNIDKNIIDASELMVWAFVNFDLEKRTDLAELRKQINQKYLITEK